MPEGSLEFTIRARNESSQELDKFDGHVTRTALSAERAEHSIQKVRPVVHRHEDRDAGCAHRRRKDHNRSHAGADGARSHD